MEKVPAGKIDELKSRFSGEIILPGDAIYEEARQLWNAMIDKRPAVIARCTSATDVTRAVAFAREHGLPLAVRGGGHNIAGNAMCNDGLVVDLSHMKGSRLDTGKGRITIEAGATLADLDRACQAHGFAVPTGINSTTGLAGLTLGGGFGWLSRKLGMTIDSLESAQVVMADGRLLTSSASEHADLFWALRGGGGNFGVVTEFEFRMHPIGPDLLSGLVVYPASQAKSVLQQYREFADQAPDELSVWAVLRQAPPLPFLPEKYHGSKIVALALLYAGDPKRGAELIEPLRHFGTPLGEHVGVQPFVAWQQTFDPLLAPGARNYWKSHNFTELKDGLFDVVLEYLDSLPSPQCEIFIGALGGATMRPAPDATAYAHREVRFVMNVHGRWAEASDDGQCIGWARDFFKAATPFASGGVYVNFLTADEAARVPSAYGENFTRLVEVKRHYDPDNFFRLNQNISPN